MGPQRNRPSQHLGYIDALRGYAILMVITCHLAYCFPELPYPVHRLAVSGWFGVQLFFLASSITLLRSWNMELQRAGRVSTSAFFLRRLFRIAPAYYLAALLYSFIRPADGYTFGNVLVSLTFLNGVTPIWANASNAVVPGGWSIGTEFAFYAVFPIFAAVTTSLRRACAVLAAAVALGFIANQAAVEWYQSTTLALSNGLFFWFPNEASVFALGGLIYVLVERGRPMPWLRRHATAVAVLAAAAFCALAYVPLGHYWGDRPILPAGIAASIALAVVVVALSSGPSFLVNRAVATMGTVSFSAYLLHFALLDLVAYWAWLNGLHPSGYDAILAYVGCWILVVSATFCLSWISYHAVERPMMTVGKAVIRRLAIGRPRGDPARAYEREPAEILASQHH